VVGFYLSGGSIDENGHWKLGIGYWKLKPGKNKCPMSNDEYPIIKDEGMQSRDRPSRIFILLSIPVDENGDEKG